MQSAQFQRARSAEAKQLREQAILDAAVRLGTERGIRSITLTDIADAVGLHKSALLRYFETREQIFLILTANGWADWSQSLCAELAVMDISSSDASIAGAFARSLVAAPMFCDLLAQAPMNLERNVSIESVRTFKLATVAAREPINDQLHRLRPAMSDQQILDLIATATAMAGALWQMATPGPEVLRLYREDPRLSHALIDVEPRLIRILTALISAT